jgi:hypothetical protein
MKSDGAPDSAEPVLTAQPLASSAPTSEELERVQKANRNISYVIVKDDAGVWRFNRIKTTVDKLQDNKTTWWLEPVPIEQDAHLSPEVTEIQQLLATAELAELLNNKSSVNARIETLIKAYTEQSRRRTLINELIETEISFVNFTKEFIALTDKLPKQENINVFMEQYSKLTQGNFLAKVAAIKIDAKTIDEYVLLKAQALADEFITEQADGTLTMTKAFEDKLNGLTNATIMYENFYKVFSEAGNDLAALEKLAIMPIQRVGRYDLISKGIAEALAKIPAQNPTQQALQEKTIAKFASIPTFTYRSNEIKRNAESLQKLLSTQAVLGKIVRDAKTLSATADPKQKLIVDKLLGEVTTIAEQTLADNLYFSASVQAKDKFYETFMNAFVQAYLSNQGNVGADLLSSMMQYIKTIDKKLQAEGMPGIVFPKTSFVFSPTASKIFATVADTDATVANDIVGKMFDTIETMIQQTPPDAVFNPDHERAYKNALSALKAIGPAALAMWNQHASMKFKALTQPTTNDYKKILTNAKVEQEWGIAQANRAVSNAEVMPETTKLTTLDILGKIADDLAIKRLVAAKYGFNQLQIWDTFSKAVQETSRSIVQSGRPIDPAAFYEPIMRAFVRGYIVHEKTQNDVFSECIRDFVVTLDKNFHQAGIAGVVYQTAQDLPGTTQKDLHALQTLKVRSKDEFQKQMVDQLFHNLKLLVESPAHGDFEKRVYNRTVDAISAMGVKAIMLWNLHADREFFELSIPTTKDYQDLFQLGRTENERREALLSMVKIELVQLQTANAELAVKDAIPEALMNDIARQLQEALYKSKSRSDLNEHIKLALLKLLSQTYVQGPSPALTLVEQFIERVETRLVDNKQKGVFVNRPEDLRPFSILGNYSAAERIFARTQQLSTPYFNRYLETFYQDFKKVAQPKPSEKQLINAVKLLEQTGLAAKEKWNVLAQQDPDTIGRNVVLPDARVQWTEKKATIMAQAQLDGNNLSAVKKLKKLMVDESSLLGPVPITPTPQRLFHHAAPITPARPTSPKIRPARSAPPIPVIQPLMVKPAVVPEEKVAPALPKVGPPKLSKPAPMPPALPANRPVNKAAEQPSTPPRIPLSRPKVAPKSLLPEEKAAAAPPIPKTQPTQSFDPRLTAKKPPPSLPTTTPPGLPNNKGNKT